MMWLGIAICTACGVAIGFFFGCEATIRGYERRTGPRPRPRHIVELDQTRIKDVKLMAIPTTELFCRKLGGSGSYTWRTSGPKCPDEIWLTWPDAQQVEVWWLTDAEIPE